MLKVYVDGRSLSTGHPRCQARPNGPSPDPCRRAGVFPLRDQKQNITYPARLCRVHQKLADRQGFEWVEGDGLG